ncbi:MAG TPA: cation diffusion facilitator family transporter [Bacilli bacterium]
MESYSNLKKSEKGAWISIITYIFLSAFKVAVGSLTHSDVLLADGLNNATDIIVSIAILIGLKVSQKPPDLDHPYGHFRAETISALIASFVMATVGLNVIFNAGRVLFQANKTAPDITAAWVAIFCALVMYLVYLYNRNLATKVNNKTLMAAARDNRSDAFVSIGAAIGIIGSQFGLPWLDPLAAVAVGFAICKTAWDIFRESSHALTDGFDETKLTALRKTIQKTSGVRAINDIKARIYGSNVFIDVVVQVDPTLNVVDSHRITEVIEKTMLKQHNISNVHIHIEPMEQK